MDFVEWCDWVLMTLIEQSRLSTTARTIGMHYRELGKFASPERHQHEADVYDALCALRRVGLVEDNHGHYWKATAAGRQTLGDMTPLWQTICQMQLEPEHEQVLRMVNQSSVSCDDAHISLHWVEGDTFADELAWQDPKLLHAIAQELEQMGLAGVSSALGRLPRFHATYQGLVWETRRGFVAESAFIDALVREWETTSVDFKRDLETRTADQKAEFVKDVLGLANTQASGRRWMIIGFDDRTRSYWSAPNSKLTQDHLEHLLSRNTVPMVQVRYEVVDYRLGPVGKLEVMREPTRLPYRVARSIGDQKRIEAGAVYVRHGSQTERPSVGELAAIEAEAERAQGAHSM